MPKTDFYILPFADEKHILQFACRLAEKAYQQQHRIYFHMQNPQQAHQLDEIMWTWRDESFLPHNLVGEGPDTLPPIQIGFDTIPSNQRDILINLSQMLPEHHTQFNRILEIIPHNEKFQTDARERYRIYRELNYPLQTHKPTQIEA
ncbi:MAG: DNA polymerase III subunit chi [Gammaproteobacteria bacterium]|nr:DNA polymerase III subunit chi [Gammaproteobacteria bacterium]